MIMRRPVAASGRALVLAAVFVFMSAFAPVSVVPASIVSVSVLSVSIVSAQDPATQAKLSADARARMAVFAPLVGEWQGSGWYRMGAGVAQQFTQRETVRMVAGGEVLVFEGLGLDADSTPVHQAFAMISWDPVSSAHVMHGYSAGSTEVTDTPHVAADSMVWGFTEPRGGQIRFTIHFDDATWREVGAYSPDGVAWYRFIEMELRRVGR